MFLFIALIMLAMTVTGYARQTHSILERVMLEKQSYLERQEEIRTVYIGDAKQSTKDYLVERESELANKEVAMEDQMEYRMMALENTARATAMRYLPVVLMIAFVVWLLSYLFEQLSSWTAISVRMMGFAIVGFIVVYFAFPAAMMLIDRIGGTK